MTTQPDLPGMPAAPAGVMHEQTFNEALGDALRQRRQLWRSAAFDNGAEFVRHTSFTRRVSRLFAAR